MYPIIIFEDTLKIWGVPFFWQSLVFLTHCIHNNFCHIIWNRKSSQSKSICWKAYHNVCVVSIFQSGFTMNEQMGQRGPISANYHRKDIRYYTTFTNIFNKAISDNEVSPEWMVIWKWKYNYIFLTTRERWIKNQATLSVYSIYKL